MMRAALADQGVHVLCNESERIERGSSHIRLAGVDDLMVNATTCGRPWKNLLGRDANIALAQPGDHTRSRARWRRPGAFGHTHGGQINWRLLTGRKDRKIARWLRRPSRRLMRATRNSAQPSFTSTEDWEPSSCRCATAARRRSPCLR